MPKTKFIAGTGKSNVRYAAEKLLKTNYTPHIITSEPNLGESEKRFLKVQIDHLTKTKTINTGGKPMDEVQYFHLKLIGDSGFIDLVKRYAEQEPGDLKVESEGKDEDPTRLGFDMATVSVVIIAVKGALLAGELGAKVWKWMRESEGNKIVVQSPFQTLELHKSAGLTEEDVRKVLKAAAELH